MDLEVDHGTHAEEQFWDDLDEALSQDCETHSHIDDVLRSYLTLIADSKKRFLESDYDLGRCSFKLASSPLFQQHADYVRRQFVYSLLQEDEAHVLLVTTSFLLADARMTEKTFELLNEEGAFPRLLDLIHAPKEDEEEALHRLLMELLYEMSRIQKISLDDLGCVTDDFVRSLFDIIEQVSDNVSDPYHYPVIRVLLVMNEQFMVAAHDPELSKRPVPVTNKVVKVLSAQGPKYRTFGENIILLLNREDETSLQLLTLKLLYLLFTTPPTYEYFYTNDLHVLVDILIRNLLDLPEEASALRHTYLRVLYPLLEHTQLQNPPHYKRNEVRKLLTVLSGAHISEQPDSPDSNSHWTHFDAIDDTTKRLVRRCRGVSWLADPELEDAEQTLSPTEENASGPSSPVSPTKPQPPALPAPRKLKKRESSKGSTLTIGQYLSPELESARKSSLSVMEMAAQKEKPGVITPSRNPSLRHGFRAAMWNKKEKPPLPNPRRSGLGRPRSERTDTGVEVTNTNVDTGPEVESPTDQKKLPPGPESPAVDMSPPKLESPIEEKKPAPQEEKSPPKIEIDTKPPAPLPPNSTKPSYKKPPPAPKARRWRGKRLKEDEDGAPREPGKFSTNLPSINTSTHKQHEASPFSPVERTLSPTSPESGDPASEQPKSSIAEALGQAQAIAVSDVAEQLENTRIDEPTKEGPQTIVESTNERPEIILESPEENQHDFDFDAEEEENEQERPAEVLPQPQVILTPPNQAPPRAIPGPKWELERSPFLSDDENESDDEGEKATAPVGEYNKQ